MEQTPTTPLTQPPAAALTLFGDRLPLVQAYGALLAGTGVEHGLIGPREVPRMWDRHLLNCGAVASLIQPNAVVADIGAGAGLPGLVLAIARPDLQVTLVEPLQRRITWLVDAVRELDLDNVDVRRDRAENATDLCVDVVTSRAVAALPKLLGWSLPLLRGGGTMLALKGSSAAEELSSAQSAMKGAAVVSAEVLACGVGVLDPPTTVIRVVAGPRRRAAVASPTGKRSNRQARRASVQSAAEQPLQGDRG